MMRDEIENDDANEDLIYQLGGFKKTQSPEEAERHEHQPTSLLGWQVEYN